MTLSNSYGTLTLADTLLVADAGNIFVREYGEDNLFAYADAVLKANNLIVKDMLAPLVEQTTKRIDRYGGDFSIDMVEVDELGIADASKGVIVGNDIGWPLKAFQASTQWSRMYFKEKTVKEFTDQFDAIANGDILNLERAIKRALFTPTNATVLDRRVDGVSIPTKALINADGSIMRRDKFGNSFDGSTHTHYLAASTAGDANVQAAVDTVIEHGTGGSIFIYINKAQEAAIRAMASFTGYPQKLIELGANTSKATGGTERYFDLDNRPIGVWDGALVVWTKPWVPANYYLVINLDADEKPLRMRTRRDGSGDLELLYEDEAYPLRARTVQREFGLSVWGRTSAAVLMTGGSSYVAPTL